MRNLIIIGAGAFGREIYDLALATRKHDLDCGWRLKGFLDDRADILDGKIEFPGGGRDVRILSPVEDYLPGGDDLFICAIGDPAIKRHYAGIIRARGGAFINLMSPLATISHNTVEFGSGLAIGPFCVISCNLRIGNDTCISSHATVGHDVCIGEGCHLSSYSFIGGAARLGDEVMIHPHACVLPGVEIGDGATVGAGSVAIRNVAAGETVFGVPARNVKI